MCVQSFSDSVVFALKWYIIFSNRELEIFCLAKKFVNHFIYDLPDFEIKLFQANFPFLCHL